MKRALSFCLVLILSILFSMIGPFSVYATGTPISGFDYTNYYELTYLQNNNNAYIDTGIAAKNIYGTEIKFNLTNTTGNIFGQGNLAGSRFYLSSGGNFYSISSSATLSFNTGTDYIFAWQSPSITLNGSSAGSVTYSHSSLTASIFLFAKRFSNSPGPMAGKIYYAKFFDSNADLIGYFVPAERKSDGVYGMFNTVNSTFYTNSGSGSFTAGNRVSYATQYTITTSVSPSGSGTVTGGGTYDEYTQIQLTATATSGYSFSEWSDGNTSNPRTIEVTQNETYTAIFVQNQTTVNQFTISVGVSPAGSGVVSGNGTYDENTVISLVATPNQGYSFVSWSDNNTQNPRSITVTQNASYTAIFTQNSEPEPDPSPSGWTDWTDSNDSEYLVDITSSVDLDKIYWSMYKKRKFDYFQIYGTQINFTSGYSGDYTASFVGTYYDNTLSGITACNSSSYESSTSTTAPTEQITVNPFVVGTLNAGQYGYLQFGIGVTDTTNSSTSITSSHQTNTSEACSLVGAYAGDVSVGVQQYLDYGYEIKTYNDGNGNTATVFVPGEEAIEFEADLEFFDNLLEGLFATITNNLQIVYHDEYSIELHGQDGYLLPEYGSFYSDAYIGTLFDWNGVSNNLSQGYFSNINLNFSSIQTESTYADFNASFSRQVDLSTNQFKNHTNLYWQNTRNPVWNFETPMQQEFYSSINYSYFGFYYTSKVYNTYGSKLSSSIGDYLTVSSSQASDFNLTQGAIYVLSGDNMKFYRYNNTSLLNRFNQLGSMMYTWFNRIYQSIGNITGGNESNDIINNVVNDYDIDVDINLNGLLQNVETYKQDIDLTLPQFNIPSNDLTAIQSISGAFKNIYQEVYIDNGLGILVFIPVILLVLRLIL